MILTNTYFSHPRGLDLDVIAQHELLGGRMQVYLPVHPLRHRIAAQVMLEPVQSYVSGTTSGTNSCR
jgi:hypothetical protein